MCFNIESIGIFIGPEGGFAEEEIEQITKNRWKSSYSWGLEYLEQKLHLL